MKTNPRPAKKDVVFNFPTISGAGVNLVPYDSGEKAVGDVMKSQEGGAGMAAHDVNYISLDN